MLTFQPHLRIILGNCKNLKFVLAVLLAYRLWLDKICFRPAQKLNILWKVTIFNLRDMSRFFALTLLKKTKKIRYQLIA